MDLKEMHPKNPSNFKAIPLAFKGKIHLVETNVFLLWMEETTVEHLNARRAGNFVCYIIPRAENSADVRSHSINIY